MAFVKLLMTGDATTEVEAEATLVLAGDVTVVGSGKSLTANDFRLGDISNVQIATGDITQTGSYHSVESQTAGADQLDGISAGADGQLLFIRPQDDGETITVAHNQNSTLGNNILLNADTNYLMDDLDDYMLLIYDAGQDAANGAWTEVSRGQGSVALLTSNAPSSVDITGNVAVGTGTEAAKDDHVHDLADGSVEAEATLAASIIGNTAIDNSATDIAFAQIILTPTATGTGTTEGTLFYDSDDDHLYVFTV